VRGIRGSWRGVLGVIPLARALSRMGLAPLRGTPGGLATDAGVDCSNVSQGFCLLPADPGGSARRVRDRLRWLTGGNVALILADTEFRVLRQGTVDLAAGVAGMEPVRRQFGDAGQFGCPKVGVLAQWPTWPAPQACSWSRPPKACRR